MPRTIELMLYNYDELPNEKAKSVARDWYREVSQQDVWWDAVYEDVVICAEKLGIQIDSHEVRTTSNKSKLEKNIYFNISGNQGDGACFTGIWRAILPTYTTTEPPQKNIDEHSAGMVTVIKEYESFLEAIKSHAPNNAILHKIAQTLDAQMKTVTPISDAALYVNIRHRGNYYNPAHMIFETNADKYNDIAPVYDVLREFADWIYKQLDDEYSVMNSDENVTECILANNYEFNVAGKRVVE